MKSYFGLLIALAWFGHSHFANVAKAQSADGFVPRGTSQANSQTQQETAANVSEPAQSPAGETADAPRAFAPTGELAPVRSAAGDSPAAGLLELALGSTLPEPVSGASLSLADMLAPVQDAGLRRAMIENYWDLSLALAADYFARDERERLRRSVVAQGDDDPALAAVLARVDARVREMRTRVIDAQHRLAILRGQNLADPLPLPSALPVTSAYRTYYNELFVRDDVPPEARLAARRLHETLPLMRDVVGARAASVVAAELWWTTAEADWRSGQSSRHEPLEAWQSLVAERRALLDAVRQYNGQIADYALLAATGDANPLRLVAMLSFTNLGQPHAQGVADGVVADGREIDGLPRSVEQPASAVAELPADVNPGNPPATGTAIGPATGTAIPLPANAVPSEPASPQPFHSGDTKMRSILVPSRNGTTNP